MIPDILGAGYEWLLGFSESMVSGNRCDHERTWRSRAAVVYWAARDANFDVRAGLWESRRERGGHG